MVVLPNDKRFSRQAKIGWFDQKKISNANCMVVGCGGIGTWTALQLTLLGVRKIILVDMDKIEESNLNRQLFFEADIGKNKVDALKDKLERINSKIAIYTHPAAVQSMDSRTYANIDFVFDCLDNIPTREYLSKLCWDKKISFIHSACSDVIGEVQLIVRGKTEEMLPYPENMKQDEDKKSCKDFDPAICTTNMITASLQIDKFLDYLINKDVKKPITNYIRGIGISYGGGK